MKLSSNVLKTLGAGVVLASLSVAAHAGSTDTVFTGGSIVTPGAGNTTSSTSGRGGIGGPVTNAPTVPEPGMIVSAASMLGMTGLGLVRGRRRAVKSAK